MSEEQQENFEQTNGENFEEFAEQQQEAMEGQEEDAEQGAGDAANDEDEDDRKLFVGNLSWETTQKDLKDYFSKYGEVTNCTLKTDLETKRSRGFGFVVFSTAALLDKVLEEKEHKLHGRNIDPKRANPRKEVCKKIFCGKVDPSVPESDIKEYFSKFGEIDKVELPFDKVKDQRRAFCFVEFKNEESVKKVLEETAHKLNNVDVDVKKATPSNQSKRGGRGGWGGGWGAWGGGRGGPGGRGGSRGGYNQGNWNQGYPGGNQGYYNQGGYGGYGSYGGYGNYDQSYYQGYGNYGSGWGGYEQYPGYGGYDYSGWGYDQGQQQQSNYGKQPKGRGGGGGYHPYSR